MEYDPVKDRMAAIARGRPWLRRLFYRILDLLFLRAWYVHRRLKQVLPFLKSPMDPKIRVLDAGTGFGQYSWYIARRFPDAQIVAVDVKKSYLEDCADFFRRTGLSDRVSLVQADLTDPDAAALNPDRPYDFILCVDVLEHIEDDMKVLRNFDRALKPGGYVLINTPSDQGGSDVKEAGEQSFIGEHVRDGYSSEELSSKLRMAGLHVIRIEYGYGPLGSAAWRLLVKRPMLMLNASFLFAAVLPFYYLVALPVGLVLNALDLMLQNRRGTGLTVLAQKLQ